MWGQDREGEGDWDEPRATLSHWTRTLSQTLGPTRPELSLFSHRNLLLFFQTYQAQTLNLQQLMVGQSGRGLPRAPSASAIPNHLACCSGIKTSWPTHSQSGGHLDGQFSGQEPAHGSFWEPGGPSLSRVAGSRQGPPRGEERSSQGILSSVRGSSLCSHMDLRLKPQGWVGCPHCSKNPGMSRSQQ